MRLSHSLSLKDLADEFGVSIRTVRRHVKEKGIPHIHLGRSMMFDPNEVEACLKNVPEPVRTFRRKGSKIQSRLAERLGI